ncbi:MAG: type II secretion system protein [Candidatus Omnitrophota bacterium]
MDLDVKGQKGVTMVEVVLAVAIVSFISLAMVAAISQSSVFSRTIDTTYTSSYIANRRIELIKRFSFDQLAFTEETAVKVGVDGNIDPDGDYVRTTEISTNYGGNSNLTKVKVTVRRLRLLASGAKAEDTYVGSPVIMETLLSNFE